MKKFRLIFAPLICSALVSVTLCPDAGAVEPGEKTASLVIADGTADCGGALREAALSAAMRLPDYSVTIIKESREKAAESVVSGTAGMALLPESSVPENLNSTLTKKFFGRSAVILIVNNANPLYNISSEQLKDLLRGRIKTWQKLSASPYTVALYLPPPGCAGNALTAGFAAPELLSPSAYRAANVQELPLRVSLTDYSAAIVPYYEGLRLPPQVHTVKIDGIAPDAENFRSGKYPLCENIWLVCSSSAAASRPGEKLLKILAGPNFRTILSENQLFL